MARPCNADNMARLVYALESGSYSQGTGALNRGGKYCCLGVACDVAMKHGVEMEAQVENESGCFCGVDHGNDSDGTRTLYDGEGGYLPDKVADWLGLEGEEGDAPFMVGTNNRTNPVLAGARATEWNDDLKASFPVIAQLFRHEFLGA